MRPASYTNAPLSRQCALLLLIALSACTTKVNQRGYVDPQHKLGQIKPGESHKQDVLAKLGSPSTVSDFGDETWYYISARQESWGFMKPELEDQEVTEIVFNTDEMVTKVDHRGLKDRKDIAAADAVTPTEGHKLGFAEQILGNVGRFNKRQQTEAR